MSESKIIKEGWVVVTPTLCQGDIISWTTEDETNEVIPLVFGTERQAWEEIADDMVTQLQQFMSGVRELEHTNFGTKEYVAQYREFNDGQIVVYNKEENILRTTLEEWRKSR